MMYPILLSIGIIGAFLWLSLVDPLPDSSQEERAVIIHQRVDAGLAALIGAFLAARLTHVGLYFDLYRDAPLDILAVWRGGLTAWGAIIGAAIGLTLHCRRRNLGPWPLADSLAAPANILALSLWLACLLDGCAYGRTAVGSILAVSGPDLMGVIQPRWPTQTIGALASIGLMAGSYYGRVHGLKSGILGLSSLIAHGLILLALSWLRADPVRYFESLRSDTLGAGLILLAGLFLSYRWWKAESD